MKQPKPSWQDNREMSRREYREIIAELGMSQAAAGRYLGISERTTHRYSSGDARVRTAEALLLRSLLAHREMPRVPPWQRSYKLKRKAR
jgi:DNA-binding transcriptional regulator YiaG